MPLPTKEGEDVIQYSHMHPSLRSKLTQTVCVAELRSRDMSITSPRSLISTDNMRKRGTSFDPSFALSSFTTSTIAPVSSWLSCNSGLDPRNLGMHSVCDEFQGQDCKDTTRRRAVSDCILMSARYYTAVKWATAVEIDNAPQECVDWESDDSSLAESDACNDEGEESLSIEKKDNSDLLHPLEPIQRSQEKLLNLQKLFQEGFITITEFEERRLQLVDEQVMQSSTAHESSDEFVQLARQTHCPVRFSSGPPNFGHLQDREAIKHIFDSDQRKWTSSHIKVKIDAKPFAQGGLRQVYHLQDLSLGKDQIRDSLTLNTYVAKVAMNPNENPDTYFRDVEMQAVAARFANLYNSYDPPRPVKFLEAWILQLMPTELEQESQGDIVKSDESALGSACAPCPVSTFTKSPHDWTLRGTICGVERYIAGDYQKHNNNFGYVSELERNTPQAFSHFTYEISGHQMLIVDIQGVGDHYTDPQIHTRRGKEFGKGNLSLRGFARFLESHRCNAICRYLKLPLHNPRVDTSLRTQASDSQSSNGSDGTNDSEPQDGTVPAQMYMNESLVCVDHEILQSQLCHYYRESHVFQQYRARRKKRLRQKQMSVTQQAHPKAKDSKARHASEHKQVNPHSTDRESECASNINSYQNACKTKGLQQKLCLLGSCIEKYGRNTCVSLPKSRLVEFVRTSSAQTLENRICMQENDVRQCGFCRSHLPTCCIMQ